MIRSVLGLLFILILQTTTFGQQTIFDSLELKLKGSSSDLERVDLLNELSNRYLAYQPQQSKPLAEEALAIAKTIGYKRGEAVALNRIGEYEFRQSNYARAVEFTTESLRLAEQLKDSSIMAMAYRVLGNTNTFGFKRFGQALQYQQKAFDIYKKLNDKRNIASFCGNITWIYGTTGENLEEGHTLANWGIHLSDSLKDYQLLSYNYNSKGLLYLKQNLLDSSLTYLALSNSAAEKSNDHAVIAYNKSIMGDIFFRKGDIQTALRLFTAAATESGELNLREVVKNSYYGLSQCYARLKNFERAYHYHMLYDELNSTLLNWETTQKALITELEFAEEKKEQKIAELELANKKARQEKFIYIILSAVFVLFMLTITALVIRNNRQRIQSNKLLQEKNYEIARQNEKLKQSNTVKDKLFSIISHDLRTPLASLKGLLAMALRKDISDAEFRGIIPKLNNLVIGTNETLENLFLWSHSQMNGWSFQPGNINLKQLTERCLSLFSESAKTKSINLESKIQSDVYALADENQLELILRNLLNNAIKFTQQGGQITLEAEVENNMVEVRITDNGIGMEAKQLQTLFDKKNTQTTRGTMGEKGTGLGLQLCKEMVEINSGTIAAESIPGKGSTFKVKLKAVKPGSNPV
ncbi:MAG: tetratricopeptide repeat-containing sensor histidine kinase [Cyclobacteriaceae bacterium]|nr:tetratricopeptide repeat-containing sensor histidine kinase [Cyclobacteriaceae bacterium]UYN87771.1 MAG: tetratricopeptide repeat-containing sensor histidine kinase [Cyclobacteriaceae bacterium]